MNLQYIFLRKQTLSPRQPLALQVKSEAGVRSTLAKLGVDPVVHVDFETTGLDPRTDKAVLLGLATEAGCASFDVREWTHEHWGVLGAWLRGRRVYAFNAAFDYKWLVRYLPDVRLGGCSSVAFRMCATEGYPAQRWSLEVAQETVLGWSASNKGRLEELLVKHGVVKPNKSPDKARMSELADLEPYEFGLYNALDAEASRQLWNVCLERADAAGVPAVRQYLTEEWAVQIELLTEQWYAGMQIDRTGMQATYDNLVYEIAEAEQKFRLLPAVAQHIDEWETAAAAGQIKTRTTERSIRARKSDQPWLDTTGYWTFIPDPKDGREFYLSPWEKPYGGIWRRTESTTKVTGHDKPAPRFNLQSDVHLRWLLYERCYTGRGTSRNARSAVVLVEGRPVEVTLTDGGQMPVGKTVLPALGEVGRLLTEYNTKTKLLSYVSVYLQASEATGSLHAEFKPHGTLNGRLAGG